MKPVRLMRGWSNTIWAVRRYKELSNNCYEVVGGAKDDVTQEAIGVVIEHADAGCEAEDCLCRHIQVRGQCGVIYPVPIPGEVVKNCARLPRHSGQHCSAEGDEW